MAASLGGTALREGGWRWWLGGGREEEEEVGGSLEPTRPTNNASRQAGCNPSPPSGPGVACHRALPLGPFCTPKMLLKRFGQ